MGNSWDRLRNRLLSLRETHGAVADFCRKTGLNRQTVENWLSGQSIPGLDKLDKIADALDLSPADLLGPQEPRKGPDIQESLGVVAELLGCLANLPPDVLSALAAFDHSQSDDLLDALNAIARSVEVPNKPHKAKHKS